MNLRNITVPEIGSAVTVYSEKGRSDRMTDRKFYGLSFCISGEIVYVQNGCEYKSDKSCAVILPKGGTYSIKRNKVEISNTKKNTLLISARLSKTK